MLKMKSKNFIQRDKKFKKICYFSSYMSSNFEEKNTKIKKAKI